ncbi:MAG: PilZ domain-containing protein [Candidatus Omnitrophica bacterium]|nr:PilZ domain-containing protein [Candidatus Omnitrophota bacterium]
MGEEKRKALRVKTSLFVQYCFDVNSAQKSWDITSVKNLSETGVCLQTGKPFEVGSVIALRFKIPSRPFEKIEINARVVCCQDIGQGTTSMIRAEFKDLSDDIKGVLREYVLWMVKNPSL